MIMWILYLFAIRFDQTIYSLKNFTLSVRKCFELTQPVLVCNLTHPFYHLYSKSFIIIPSHTCSPSCGCVLLYCPPWRNCTLISILSLKTRTNILLVLCVWFGKFEALKKCHIFYAFKSYRTCIRAPQILMSKVLT